MSKADRLGGYCDGLIDDYVAGWVINYDRPGAIESVFVQSDLGERLEFKAIQYRRDLVKQFGRNEKFGFTIPVTALPPFKRTIRLFTRDGVVLRNGVIDLSEVDISSPLTTGCKIFMHIPKTAGTSLRVALQRQPSPAEICLFYPDWPPGIDWHTVETMPAHQRQALRMVIGHVPFGVHEAFQPTARYYTFVREPIERLKSNYLHYRRHAKTQPMAADGRFVPLYRGINEGLIDFFDNYQTRMISGIGFPNVRSGRVNSRTVDLALCNIERWFDFVGLTERIDVDYPAMFEKMSLRPVPLTKENVAPAISYEDDPHYRLVDWDRVCENNRYDLELYDVIAKRAAPSPIAPSGRASNR